MAAPAAAQPPAAGDALDQADAALRSAAVSTRAAALPSALAHLRDALAAQQAAEPAEASASRLWSLLGRAAAAASLSPGSAEAVEALLLRHLFRRAPPAAGAGAGSTVLDAAALLGGDGAGRRLLARRLVAEVIAEPAFSLAACDLPLLESACRLSAAEQASFLSLSEADRGACFLDRAAILRCIAALTRQTSDGASLPQRLALLASQAPPPASLLAALSGAGGSGKRRAAAAAADPREMGTQLVLCASDTEFQAVREAWARRVGEDAEDEGGEGAEEPLFVFDAPGGGVADAAGEGEEELEDEDLQLDLWMTDSSRAFKGRPAAAAEEEEDEP